MKLDVYDVTNTTLQGTLSAVFGAAFLDDMVASGSATFQVDVASTADLALLQPRRVVRFRTGASAGTGDVFGCVVQDRPAVLEGAVEPQSGAKITTVTFECLSLWDGWLGGSTGGAVLYPYGGMDGRQQNPRLFGPYAADFDDSGWAAPTIGAGVSTDGWPDASAVAFQFVNNAVYRRELLSTAGAGGLARMYVAATWKTRVQVFLDGDLVLEKQAGKSGLVYADVAYEEITHQLAIDVVNEGSTGRVAWTWVRLVESTDGDGNEVFELGTTIRRTYDPADFPAADTNWMALENYTDFPGVTVGYVAKLARDEAATRGHTPLPTVDFTAAADSGSAAWGITFARGFRLQELGKLLDELTYIEGEPEFTPAGVWRLWKRRGTNRAATVTVASPVRFGLTGRGPQSTRWLYETDGGLGQATNATAETALSVRMEQFVQLGTDISPDGIGPALVRQLLEDGEIRDEVEIELPAGVTPYTTFFLGDTITVDSRAGSTQTVRVTSIGWGQDQENDGDIWTITAIPYAEPA